MRGQFHLFIYSYLFRWDIPPPVRNQKIYHHNVLVTHHHRSQAHWFTLEVPHLIYLVISTSISHGDYSEDYTICYMY